MTRLSLHSILFSLLALLCAPLAAQAAQDYDNCTGVISSLPTVISTAGTWCVKQSLSTSISSGNVIDVQADNVTIDCNDFKIDGTAAGSSTAAVGIWATQKANVTVRRCGVRGFRIGLSVTGSGDTIEDNRLEGNICYAMYIYANGSVIRRNRVFNTGGSTLCGPVAIQSVGAVDVLDNTISGVAAANGSTGTLSNAYGIGSLSDPGGSIVGNRIRGVVKAGSGVSRAIEADNREIIVGNDLVGDGSAGSYGMDCFSTAGRTKDNIINGFSIGIGSCTSAGDVVHP